MSNRIYWFVCLVLTACGTKGGDVQDVQVESGSQPVPPQPVIGSYLAAAFETPDTVDRNACSFSFHEGPEVFTSSLTLQPYQLVPISDIKKLKTIHIECLGADSRQVFSASLNLSNSALEQMNPLLVSQPSEPIKFVARFFADGGARGQSTENENLSMEKLDVSEIDDKADQGKVGSGSTDDDPSTSSNPQKVTSPEVLGVKIIDHPTDSKLRILQVVVVARNLAKEPYSFNGGKVWTQQNSFVVERRTWFDKSLIVVRDAEGKQTQLQGLVYTDN